MYSQAKKLSSLYLPALFICMLLLSACENSLNDIKKIASTDEDKPMARSTGVDIIYSDSAKVKAHLTAPLEIDYTDAAKPYEEMSKGVKIIFYDDDLAVKGTITSEYALKKDKEHLIEFHKNVVATNAQGETFKSDELIYDETGKKIYSNKPVEITMTNGDKINGKDFFSNESLYPWHLDQSTGIFHVTENGTGINP